MNQVLITNENKGQNISAAPVLSNPNKNQFSETLMLSKADALLRNTTSQYQKWKTLRQNNGAIAVKIADAILARHEILKDAQQGRVVDWSRFDALTKEIRAQDIFLFDSSKISHNFASPHTSKAQNTGTANGPGAPAYDSFKPESLKESSDEKKDSGLTKQLAEPLPATKNLTIVEKNIAAEKTITAEKKQPDETPAPEKNQAADNVAAPDKSGKSVTNEFNAPFALSDDNFVLTNVEYKQYLLGNGLTGYGDPDHLFLAFQEIADALDFSIQTDPASGTAEGWFISEDRSFFLDLGKKEVWVDGKTMAIPGQGIQSVDGEIYIDANLFSKWFPVDFDYDYTRQSVKIQPKEQLPFQARLEREGRWARTGTQKSREAVLPREETDYKWFEFPYIDIDINSAYRPKQSTNKTYTSLELHSTGDLGKMSSEIKLDLNSNEEIEDFSFKLERKDPDGKLLGPLNASSLEIGDIDSVYIPGAKKITDERGIKISNKELFKSNDFDTTFFHGTLKPDWDVELYRNGALIDSMRVDENGEYEFTDVSTYYGQNDFKIVAYGPQGQKEVETKSINIGKELLKVGQGEYNMSVTQKNAVLDEIYDDEEDSRDEGSITGNVSYDYGLTDQMSLGAGISSQEVSEERHQLIDLNVKRNFMGINFRGDYLYDTEGGTGLEATAKTRIGDVNLNFEQTFYDDLLTKNYSQSKFSASKVFQGNAFLPDISTAFDLKKTFYDDYDITYAAFRLSTNVKGIALRNYLDWTKSTHSQEGTDELSGDFNADLNFGKLRLGGKLGYDITPDFNVTDASISGSMQIIDNLRSSLYLKKDFENDDSTELSLGLNWKRDNGKYVISPKISQNSDGETTVGLLFSTSIGKNSSNSRIRTYSDEMADNGKASVKVFHDKNNNAVLDEGDEVLKGVSVKAVQSYDTAKTDEEGVAFFPYLRNYKPTDVVVDPSSLEDPFWEPSTPGNSIVPRPGHVHTLEIPVAAVGEIDGNIFKEGKDGWNEPLSYVKIQLVDESGMVIQEVFSEFDGYYYFPKVFPGKYSVQIDPDTKKCQGRTIDPIPVEIGNEGSVESGLDFVLGKDGRMIATTEEPLTPGKSESAEKTIREESEKSITPIEPTVVRQESISKTKPEELNLASVFQKAESNIAMAGAQTTSSVKAAQSAIPIVNQAPPVSQPGFNFKKETVSRDIQMAEPSSAAFFSRFDRDFQNTDTASKYSLHLSSYRTAERAAAGIDYLLQKHKGILKDTDFTIKRVKVSEEKGIWYRVMAGQSNNREEMEQMRKQVKMASPYCKVVAIETNENGPEPKGVHLTSFRKHSNARKSIQELKAQYPSLLKEVSFTIQDVDLGPKMGKWQRVIAGRFPDEHSAALLARKIKMKAPYAKVMELGKQSDLGIHMASFKTRQKAVRGLKILQKKYGSLFKNQEFSIHRVNLGSKKGTWYRVVAGRFDDKQAALPVRNLLKEKDQYARIMNF